MRLRKDADRIDCHALLHGAVGTAVTPIFVQDGVRRVFIAELTEEFAIVSNHRRACDDSAQVLRGSRDRGAEQRENCQDHDLGDDTRRS
jgi:hypothetical protein